jgi:hypothetical protein
MTTKDEFKVKLRSLQFSTKGFETTKQNYYDRESIEKTFGHDAKDKMMERTQGLGAGFTDRNGDHWHTDRKTNERVRTTPKQQDEVYLNAASEDWES